MQVYKKGLIGIVIAAPLAVPITGLLAQEGKQASFTIGERLRYVNEEGFSTPQNEGFSLVTTLAYAYQVQNANQTFTFDTGTSVPLYAQDNNNFNSTFVLEDPFARVGYILENRTSALAFNASYRRSDVGLSNFFDETIDEDVVTGGGKRDIYATGVRLTFGRETPVSTQLGYAYLRSEFTDADPSLDDSTTQIIDGRVDFRLSPVASVFVFADWREEDRDRLINPTRTTTSYGIGTTYALSSVTDVTARLSYDTDEDDLTSNEGLGFGFGLARAVSDGTWRLDASGTETIDGFRQQISGGRSYDLKTGGFGYTIGAVKDEGTSIEPLVNLFWNQEISDTSRFNVILGQNPSFDDDDNSVIRTRLAIGYQYDINSISSLSADFRVANDNRFGSDATDSRSAIASLSYNRAVGGNWDLVSGISYETEQRDNRQDLNTSTIFVGIERTFDFRP
jgi:hypothetical protein